MFAALIATSVRSSALGGAILLGWAALVVVLPLNLLTNFSTYSGLVKIVAVLMLLLIAAFVALAFAYISTRSRQGADVGEPVASGRR